MSASGAPLLGKDEKGSGDLEGQLPAAPGGPKTPFDKKVQEYPRTTATASFLDRHGLENFTLPGMIAMAAYLYSELEECIKASEENSHGLDIPYAIIVGTMLLYTLQNLSRAGIHLYRSMFNLDQALIEDGIADEMKVQQMNTSRIGYAANLCDIGTSGSLITAAGLLANEQFNEGIAALWFSVATNVASSILRMKQGRDNHLIITGEEYQGVVTGVQQLCLAGIPIIAAGGIWFAVVNHEVQKELEKSGDAAKDPHAVQALAAQATMIGGLLILTMMPRLRSAEALEAAIESVAKKQNVASVGIYANRSTMWGSFRRLDVAGLELGFLNTALSAGTVAALSQNQNALLTLLPALGAGMGLSLAANLSADRIARDIDAVIQRLLDPKLRPAAVATVEAEIEDDKGHCVKVCGRKFG